MDDCIVIKISRATRQKEKTPKERTISTDKQKSIASSVRELVLEDSILQEALQRDIVNYSKLARQLQAQIGCDDSQAIYAALRRMQKELGVNSDVGED